MPNVLLAPREYNRSDCVVFCKTQQEWGGLSNMCAGYPLKIGAANFLTAEHLYQCCKHPTLPDVQQEIYEARSPIVAKAVSRRHEPRSDWELIKVKAMRWVLYVKAYQHPKFRQLLLATEDRPIVELSFKDQFWGAKPDGNKLVGTNILGRLLVEVREQIKKPGMNASALQPPDIQDFYFFGTQHRGWCKWKEF